MPSDNKELQDWESEMIQICTDLYYDCKTIKELDKLTDKALALIADQCRLAMLRQRNYDEKLILKARVEELSEIPHNPNFINEYIADRLKTLEASDE